MYTYGICLMSPIGTAIQNLLDICHDYSIANYILFYPLSLMIRSEPLRFVNENKYLAFAFCNINKDDKDIVIIMS